MRSTEDISYPTLTVMLVVFLGLALLSNFTRAANVSDQENVSSMKTEVLE